MWAALEQSGGRRLWVAAGLSLALHAIVVVAVPRHPGGAAPLHGEQTMPPLVARLATAVGDAVFTATAMETGPLAEPRIEAPPAASASAPSPQAEATADTGTVHYFKSSELERRPFPLARVEVPPPESAGINAGSVIIRLRISERGRVEDAKVVMGTGIAEFEAAALREFSRAQFHPGYRDNQPVRSEMLIEVSLRPPASDNKGGSGGLTQPVARAD